MKVRANKAQFLALRSARLPLARTSQVLARSDKALWRRAALSFVLSAFALTAAAGIVLSTGVLRGPFAGGNSDGEKTSAVTAREGAPQQKPAVSLPKKQAGIAANENAYAPPAPDAQEGPAQTKAADLKTLPAVGIPASSPFPVQTAVELSGVPADFVSQRLAPAFGTLTFATPASTGDAEPACLTKVKSLIRKTVILFDVGSTAVPFKQSQALRNLAEAVTDCQDARIDVGGHTDRSGEQISNLKLSWDRAQAVIQHIAQFGFKTDQFSPAGYSSTRPATTDPKPESQALNRRVEFSLRQESH